MDIYSKLTTFFPKRALSVSVTLSLSRWLGSSLSKFLSFDRSTDMDRNKFLQLLNGFNAVPVEDVFCEYKNNPHLNWFHLMCSIHDFKFIFTSKDFKFYSLCRCHQVTHDGEIVHEHVHALISTKLILQTWKKRLYRKKIKLYKTTFKNVLCGDHVCGILRYLACKTGLKYKPGTRKGEIEIPHTHYGRMVDVKNWLHSRGKFCVRTRKDIETKMKLKINLQLHDYETCECPRGSVGINNRKEANRKRKEFFESEEGLDWKERRKKTETAKDEIIEKLYKIKRVKNELLRKELERLINLL
jgi:hypothetical protein